jgi:hypothetical protein
MPASTTIDFAHSVSRANSSHPISKSVLPEPVE